MGRRILGAIVALAIAGAVVVWGNNQSWWPWPSGEVVALPDSGSTNPPGGVAARPADAISMTVESITDGDTIRAVAEEPNDVVPTRESTRIRLIGIDTPEMRPSPECGAVEATAHLAQLLPVGATVWISVDREAFDQYERRLFYVWTDDGRFVNHELVAAGVAEVYVIPPNDAHEPLLLAAERRAQAAGLGLWGSC